MKGVLICGGTGSRLKPLTEITNKSLLPVYDRPLIQFPLQTLLAAGIREIAVITGPEHMDQMTNFLGSGSRFGCPFGFRVQEKPEGIAQALGLAEEFVDGDSVCAILGDNVFFDDLSPIIKNFKEGAHVFLKEVSDPERFGVAGIKHTKNRNSEIVTRNSVHVLSLEEKPKHPKSNLAMTGCYLFDARCFEVIRHLKPSHRGELEITDTCRWFLEHDDLSATILVKDWIDAGTFESLFRAAEMVRSQRTAL
ncbi:NTP transferase domain-containing protein [Candidatus Peregrinibacteria bacterium]|nr:NTP transferase domain-containing protein [Candidatus Peregrinibacteria bacterium]MBI3816620.1 NTP transferase domain-containing protein [Candidatus Peregrinibacteria bacterium]